MLWYLALLTGLALAEEACILPTTGTPGLDAVFYTYPWLNDDLLRDLSFMTGGYKSQELVFDSEKGITDINFFFSGETVGHSPSSTINLYGKTLPGNLLIEFTGYFVAPLTGSYNLTIVADDGGLVQFGTGQAFGCCSLPNSTAGDEFSLFAHWNSQTDAVGVTTNSVDLVAKYAYPLKIVYVNMDGQAVLNFKIIGPDGNEYSDFKGSIAAAEGGACPVDLVTTTVTWTGTEVSTTTISGSGTDTIEILTTMPHTTLTTPWTDSITSTTTITGTDSTVTVEILTPTENSSTTLSSTVLSSTELSSTKLTEIITITTPWTGHVTSTTTLTGSDDTITVEVLTPTGWGNCSTNTVEPGTPIVSTTPCTTDEPDTPVVSTTPCTTDDTPVVPTTPCTTDEPGTPVETDTPSEVPTPEESEINIPDETIILDTTTPEVTTPVVTNANENVPTYTTDTQSNVDVENSVLIVQTDSELIIPTSEVLPVTIENISTVSEFSNFTLSPVILSNIQTFENSGQNLAICSGGLIAFVISVLLI